MAKPADQQAWLSEIELMDERRNPKKDACKAVCVLCHTRTDLERSHAIPKSVHKAVGGNDETISSSGSGASRNVAQNAADARAYGWFLLCKACENQENTPIKYGDQLPQLPVRQQQHHIQLRQVLLQPWEFENAELERDTTRKIFDGAVGIVWRSLLKFVARNKIPPDNSNFKEFFCWLWKARGYLNAINRDNSRQELLCNARVSVVFLPNRDNRSIKGHFNLNAFQNELYQEFLRNRIDRLPRGDFVKGHVDDEIWLGHDCIGRPDMFCAIAGYAVFSLTIGVNGNPWYSEFCTPKTVSVRTLMPENGWETEGGVFEKLFTLRVSSLIENSIPKDVKDWWEVYRAIYTARSENGEKDPVVQIVDKFCETWVYQALQSRVARAVSRTRDPVARPRMPK